MERHINPFTGRETLTWTENNVEHGMTLPSPKRVGFHQHRWRGSTQFGVLHAVCVRCGQITMNPHWPMWRLAKSFGPYREPRANGEVASESEDS